MANLSKDLQCTGSDTRPPMIDRTDVASWQQHIRLYCQDKENGPEQPRVYSDLSPKEKERYNADIRATNILLQGLPKDIYTLINHYTNAKDIWDNVKMLLEGLELTKEDRESQLGLRDSNYDQLYAYLKKHEAYANENKMMFWVVVQNVQGRLNRDKMLLMQAQENGVALDEDQLLFLAGGQDNTIDEDVDEQHVQDLALNVDNVFQAYNFNAFYSDVDEVPMVQTMFMANLSSADPVYDEADPSYDSNILFEVLEIIRAVFIPAFGKDQGSPGDKIICDLDKTPDLSQRSPQNCPKYGNPVDGQYCQGCGLLRKKFKEDLFTYCIENGILQDSSELSNDNTNVVNALREPFVVNQDPGNNSSQSPPQINHHCFYECGDPLEDIFCHQCTCEFCGKSAHYGYNYPPKVSIIPNPKPFNNQTINEIPQTLPSFDSTCYSKDGNSFTYDPKSNLVHDSPNVFDPLPQPPLYSCEF
nr:integrase, catalytic region, zinc finger, CCHC-type, peptidase aspartic, catalytic [Tanacetum cinerariifolium]